MRILLAYLLVISILTTNVCAQISNNISSDKYKVFVDGYHGFYRIYDIKTGKETTENNKDIFKITIGDTVTWSNEDPVESLTLISEPILWPYVSGYIDPAKTFSYTFNESGIYNIHIRQSQSLSYQTIIVEDDIRHIDITENIENKKENINITAVPESKSKINIESYKKTSGFGVNIVILVIIMTYIMFKRLIKGGDRKYN